MSQTNHDNSLQEVHQSIDPSLASNKWKKVLAFFGPAYLVSVGYMDPGNWATDIAGGSAFGYTLIWVLLMSNLMALVLQSFSARLGIVQGRDLAQCSRAVYPQAVNFVLYIFAEIAIAACDLAEVLGMAIGLNLLFGIPMLWGVLITTLDTVLLLYLQKLGMRKLEAFIIALITVIGGCFLVELFFAKPVWGDVAKGFVPSIPNSAALYIAIGIIGATIMPHNLYLHSSLVQTRKINRDDKSIKRALKLNNIDSAIALNIAFLVNAAILVVGGAVFYVHGHHDVASLQDAHQLLAPLMGSKWASYLFAIALIAAGQSSTITGTLAGQIVMEGYLRLRINPLVRRLLTRLLAIVPTVIVILVAGDKMLNQMLIFSQVLLSMQLSFAVIPLVHFVSDKQQMGKFALTLKTKIVAWLVTAIIVALNMKLFFETVADWLRGTNSLIVQYLIMSGALLVLIVLAITFFYPFILKRKEAHINIHKNDAAQALGAGNVAPFRKIALALDFSDKDQRVIQYTQLLAPKDSTLILIHIVESASAKLIGDEAQDLETRNDQEHLAEYEKYFIDKGFQAKGILGFRNRSKEIARIINENNCDLLVIGSHGHKAMGDMLFGETINSVRHLVGIPIFIAR
ncbi:MAG: Nramp family divalent metal transporter [Flavipsychrobacter sp.]|nr:Nramp family divalent metal transporter [Flavipsychrobacter sp.]